ncbi:MAG: AbiH family protein [Clostridium sp.]
MYGFCRESNRQGVKKYLWKQFEKNLSCINEGEIIDFGTGIEMGLEGGDIGIEDTLNDYWEEQYGFIEKLNCCVKDWVEKIDLNIDRKSKIISEEFNDLFLTFNYTLLLENIYGIDNSNILHIHGSIDKWYDCEPVIGHGEYSKINEMKQLAYEASEEFLEKEASIYSAIANYYERTLKDVEYFKRTNNSFFKQLNGITKIFIVGYSFGEVDKVYFQEIKKNVDDDIMWNVSYHDKCDRKKYKNSVLALGVKEKNIRMLHTDEFFELQR